MFVALAYHTSQGRLAMNFTVLLLLFSSPFLQPIFVFSQTNGKVTVGSSLAATAGNSSSWLSPSGDFAFGFTSLENNDLFLLSIWYAKIPDKTIVWYAYGDDQPAVAPKGSTVNLTANSGLVLTSPQGEELWKSQTSTGVIVANGVFNDTGNFVLKDVNSSKLWESFKNPADTMLPGQTIERGGILSSRQSESNYSKGRFQLRLQPDGNLVLNTIDLANKPYYASETTNGTEPGSEGKQLVLNDSGFLYLLRENDGKFTFYGADKLVAREYYTRATLNFDGVFAQYVHPRSSSGNISWTQLWSGPENSSPNAKKSQTVILATSLVVCLVFIAAAVSVGLFFIRRKKHVIRFTQSDLVMNLRSFSYQELREATGGFSEELGRGSFGVVYKGTIQNDHNEVQVAVKKLQFVVQDGYKEFKMEANLIGKIHHKNVVHLVGYCDEGQQRMLVYEFLSKGTLASFLFADVKPSWGQRMQIAYELAGVLMYLHEECRIPIIHCDIKPQNILLDENYNVRIADFGMAKLLMNRRHAVTAIRGTKGYVAPEWFRRIPITTKVDVYSFGVVLLEIICCRRSVDMESDKEEEAILTDWVYNCYLERKLENVLHRQDEALDDKTQLQKLVMVALWCIQEDPSVRPTMIKVVAMLEGVVEVDAPPCPSSYTT